MLRARRRPGGCGDGEASPRPGQRRRHPALTAIAGHPARRAEITPPLPARARGPQAAPATRRRARRARRAALAGLPQQARAGIRGALRADAGDLAGQLARAAHDKYIAFPIGARRIAPLRRLPDGAAQDDWREATGTDAARAAVRITGPAGAR